MRKGEGAGTALVNLVSKGRRRYGGYIVHIGVVFMFIGFTGAAYDVEQESALRPGETMDIGKHTVRYDQPRMETDPNKRMIFTDMTLLDKSGNEDGQVAPGKFIYRTHPQMPTTEVAIRSRPAEDVYVIMSTVDPSTQRGTFRIIIRPLVAWIWFGGIVLLFGALLGMWPTGRELLRDEAPRVRRFRFSPATAVVGFAILLATMIAWAGVASAQNDSSSSLHAGSVVINDPGRTAVVWSPALSVRRLRALAARYLRVWLGRRQAHRGPRAARCGRAEPTKIQESYRAQYGAAALAIPSDEGLDRALWAVPIAAMVLAVGFIVVLGRRWQRRGVAPRAPTASDASEKLEYDSRLDAELDRLEES